MTKSFYSALIMKTTFLFITFNLLCPFSLAYAMPLCETAWIGKGANLREKNLQSANLRAADLGWADLRRADLTGANLFFANLFSAKLGGAKLAGAKVTKKQAKYLSSRGFSGFVVEG